MQSELLQFHIVRSLRGACNMMIHIRFEKEAIFDGQAPDFGETIDNMVTVKMTTFDTD